MRFDCLMHSMFYKTLSGSAANAADMRFQFPVNYDPHLPLEITIQFNLGWIWIEKPQPLCYAALINGLYFCSNTWRNWLRLRSNSNKGCFSCLRIWCIFCNGLTLFKCKGKGTVMLMSVILHGFWSCWNYSQSWRHLALILDWYKGILKTSFFVCFCLVHWHSLNFWLVRKEHEIDWFLARAVPTAKKFESTNQGPIFHEFGILVFSGMKGNQCSKVCLELENENPLKSFNFGILLFYLHSP